MVPGETCAERPERGNRGHIRKVTLSAQESAEAIVPELGRAEVMQSGVTGERRTAWREQKTPKAAAACKGIARNAKSMQERRVLSDRKLEKRKSGSQDCWKGF